MKTTNICKTKANETKAWKKLCLSVTVVTEILLGQEAQLSQRDRATLPVIEYFAKSLKIIRNDTVA